MISISQTEYDWMLSQINRLSATCLNQAEQLEQATTDMYSLDDCIWVLDTQASDAKTVSKARRIINYWTGE